MKPHELLECERRTESALARAASRLHEQIEVKTPVDYLMLCEEAEEFEVEAAKHEDGQKLLADFFTRFFDFLYEEGPHPGWVLRRLYMLARRYRPELILHMNGTDLGMLFGETRANQSHRMQLIFDRLKAAGVRGNRGGGCKTESSRGSYAEAAEGNHNRAGGKRKKRK